MWGARGPGPALNPPLHKPIRFTTYRWRLHEIYINSDLPFFSSRLLISLFAFGLVFPPSQPKSHLKLLTIPSTFRRESERQ